MKREQLTYKIRMKEVEALIKMESSANFLKCKPAKEGVSDKATEQTEHERGAKEVGDSVGSTSIAHMHSTSQISHQINSNTKRC